MKLKTNEIGKILIGALLGALGTIVVELSNRNDMYETIQEEVSKQLAETNQENTETEEES